MLNIESIVRTGSYGASIVVLLVAIWLAGNIIKARFFSLEAIGLGCIIWLGGFGYIILRKLVWDSAMFDFVVGLTGYLAFGLYLTIASGAWRDSWRLTILILFGWLPGMVYLWHENAREQAADEEEWPTPSIISTHQN